MADWQSLQEKVLKGDRVALGQAITLIESNKPEHRQQANQLLSVLLPHTGRALRIGITGVPGVGKSTFIEALGSYLTARHKKLAVLAIDPSSPQSKGSILGDKTRMNKLAADPLAFIRPSPAGNSLGGVAAKTMETILLCESAGYEIIFVETVGVGQSEVAVRNLTDIFLLLMLAGAGDELQGIKRGIVEMADLMVINKADGANKPVAEQARQVYASALHLFVPRINGWQPPVLTCSALTGQGIAEVWQAVQRCYEHLQKHKLLEPLRAQQKEHWFRTTLQDELMQRVLHHPAVKKQLPVLQKEVVQDQKTPYQAAEEILQLFFEQPH